MTTLKNALLTAAIAVTATLATQTLSSRFIENDLSAISPAAETPDTVATRETLKCGYVPYPPYFNIDPATGEKAGIMVDVMTSVAEKTGWAVEWTEETGWGSMIEGIKAGRYDAVCSGVWQNTNRTKQAGFSMPIGYSQVFAWVRSDDTRLTNLPQINAADTRIAMIDGEAGQMIAHDYFPKATAVALPQNVPFSDVLMSVTTNKADVVFAEEPVVQDFLKTHPGALKKLGGAVISYPITLMLPESDPQLREVVNAALFEIINSPRMAEILAKNTPEQDVFSINSVH